jgi:hypothetical protein
MGEQNHIAEHKKVFLKNIMKWFDLWAIFFFLFFSWFFLYSFNFLPESDAETPEKIAATEARDTDLIENGIHVNSGLIVDDGYELVLQHCGGCHSHKLVTQNSANADGWTETIRWMQKTQNLWKLGANEAPIVAYLAKNYGVKKKSRRAALKDIDWYEL